jgi:hypothetical protein
MEYARSVYHPSLCRISEHIRPRGLILSARKSVNFFNNKSKKAKCRVVHDFSITEPKVCVELEQYHENLRRNRGLIVILCHYCAAVYSRGEKGHDGDARPLGNHSATYEHKYEAHLVVVV